VDAEVLGHQVNVKEVVGFIRGTAAVDFDSTKVKSER
jgi:hypothetical protein